ncbi:methyltransferase domain-containing protein [Actinoplanes sp. TRM 88003]|uniref:Methyltransferase domain-containing protein n=1 Tax=Paractinoplanes aksuensis TaxID=2939490 RepID=A0ABT1DF55_9ACTN|nr:methyltransferase domain-containing protein [Actinoplanes aksuensis]MCO8269447.1 methyltransferase domain-containing protein [Actinoplanes aksuensis]
MTYRLIEGDPDPSSVRRITFVPFLPDGRCAARPGPELLTATVNEGDHYLLDTCLTVPVDALAYRPQRVHPFAADGDHLYVWLDGDRTGDGPTASADDFPVVRDGLASFREQSDDGYYADNVRLLEPAYLRGATPQAGSGFDGDADRWRARREQIVDHLHRDGTFLDVGCANGLLMESIHAWAAERGRTIEPYGIDLAPRLVGLARARLPHWSDRIEHANAIDYRPQNGRRFTFVHVLPEAVPARRRPDLFRHLLTLVEPGGRLLISRYGDSPTTSTITPGASGSP